MKKTVVLLKPFDSDRSRHQWSLFLKYKNIIAHMSPILQKNLVL